MICPWEKHEESFETLINRQDKKLAYFENAIRDFLSESKNHKTPTRFVLNWQNKFSDALNYRFDYNDDYIRTKRKLRKVEDVVREFIDEVNNQDENFEMPNHEDDVVRMYLFVESMKQLKSILHWRDRFYDSMELPL